MITFDIKEMKEYQDYINLCNEAGISFLPFEENWKRDKGLVEVIRAYYINNKQEDF